MPEEQLKDHSAGQNGFEHEDMSPAGVMYFMLGLAVVAILIHFILTGMYRYLDSYDKTHQAPMNPMAVKTGVDPRAMTFSEVQGKVETTFPKPVLERSEQIEVSDFGKQLRDQDQILASYDWVDQKNGVVRIPIDKAMDLVAVRGLPVRTAGPAAATPQKNEASKSPKKTTGN